MKDSLLWPFLHVGKSDEGTMERTRGFSRSSKKMIELPWQRHKAYIVYPIIQHRVKFFNKISTVMTCTAALHAQKVPGGLVLRWFRSWCGRTFRQDSVGTSNDVTRACANTMGGKLLCNTLVKYCGAINGYWQISTSHKVMVAHTKHSHEGKIRCKCRRQRAILNNPVREQHGTLSNLSLFSLTQHRETTSTGKSRAKRNEGEDQ